MDAVLDQNVSKSQKNNLKTILHLFIFRNECKAAFPSVTVFALKCVNQPSEENR